MDVPIVRAKIELVTSDGWAQSTSRSVSLGILRERECGIQGVPEIAAGFQSLLKQGGVSVPRYSHKYSRLAYSEML